MIKIDPIEIKAFLDQAMPPKEMEAFEMRLKEEPELRSALEDYRQLFDGLEQLQWNEMEAKVKEWSRVPVKDQLETELIDQELISLYYNGELDEALKAHFEERLQLEPEFSKQLKDYKAVFDGMDLLQRQEIEQKVRKLSAEGGEAATNDYDTPTVQPAVGSTPGAAAPSAKKRRLFPIGIAAALTAALIFGWLSWWNATETPSLEAFLSEQYEVPIDIGERSEDLLNQESAFSKGIKSYNANLYDQSLVQFEAVSSEDHYYLQSRYYMAHIQYQQKKYRAAFENFSLVADQFSNPSYSTKGMNGKNNIAWNQMLALSHLYKQSKAATDRKALEQLLDTYISQQKEGGAALQDATQLKALLEGH